jgi:hypothetical protein
MDDKLIERLRSMYSHRGDGFPTQCVNPDGREAADRIEALEAEIADLHRDIEIKRKKLEDAARAKAEGRREGIEMAAEAVNKERLEEVPDNPGDVGYMAAIRDCIAAIRALDIGAGHD